MLAAAASSSSLLAQTAEYLPAVVDRHDAAVDYYLKNQVTDPNSRWRGGLTDAYGLHSPGSSVGLWDAFTAAFVCQQSRHYRRAELIERIRLAAGFVERSLSPNGNIYLPITNFDSPPDTAFATKTAAGTYKIAQQAGVREIVATIEPLLKRFVEALIVGGIHTPNHRWVLSAALAKVNEFWPDPRLVKRIDQWLAEGIDIDADGQFSERSTATYNAVCCESFTIMADKLKRPELLEPVRRNLDAMLYLLHPYGEVETGFSRRQDLNTRGTMVGYWLAIQYLAAKLGERKYGALANDLFPKAAPLSQLMQWPELNRPSVPADPLPDNYVRGFLHNHVMRLRRGMGSVTIHSQGRSRFLSVRGGDCVIEGIRFASAFFGKGQFVPSRFEHEPGTVRLIQQLEGPYYQPFTPTRKIDADSWDQTQKQRPQTEVCRLQQSATIREIPGGLEVTLEAQGTDNVPLAVEFSLREGTKIEGCEGKLWTVKEARLSTDRHHLSLTGGGCEHKYLEVRGAEPHLPGPAIFVTGYTPFRRTITIRWG